MFYEVCCISNNKDYVSQIRSDQTSQLNLGLTNREHLVYALPWKRVTVL
jgi:hypothetical protein